MRPGEEEVEKREVSLQSRDEPLGFNPPPLLKAAIAAAAVGLVILLLIYFLRSAPQIQ